MRFDKTLLAFISAASMWTSVAAAGPYSDDLAKCLVKSTTQEDRVSLIKWLFAAASRHPAVSSIANVSPAQLDEANKTIGALTMRLLTDSCRDEAQKAIQYEGLVTLQLSFQVLGQVAGQELFRSPEVASSMAGLQKYLNSDQLKALAGTK